jgi:hypothetical protein
LRHSESHLALVSHDFGQLSSANLSWLLTSVSGCYLATRSTIALGTNACEAGV